MESFHLPWHIKKTIVGFADPVTRLALEKCSQELRSYASKSSSCYEKICLFLAKGYVSIGLFTESQEVLHVGYTPGDIEEDCDLHAIIGTRETRATVKNFFYLERAALDFSTVFRSPDVRVKELEICTHDLEYWKDSEQDVRAFMAELFNALSEVPHQICVEHLKVTLRMDQDEFLCVLQFVKPGNLKKITFWGVEEHQDMDLVASMEQWRMSTELYMDFWSGGPPALNFLHFRNVSFGGGWIPISIEELVAMTQAFYGQGEDFQRCYLEDVPYEFNPFVSHLIQIPFVEFVEPLGVLETYVRIPNGKFGLHIYASPRCLVFYNPMIVKPGKVKWQPLF